MQKINIIQFLPYFPPHKGGLESHAKQRGERWIQKGYGQVYNIVTSFDQNIKLGTPIKYKGHNIGYKQNNIENLIAPSLEIIPTFPIYKFWTKEYKLIIKYLKNKPKDIVISRTRFFLTSLIGGIYAKRNKLERIHIEHGSGYVQLNSKFKNIIAWIYDRTIGMLVFRRSDRVVPISQACKRFAQKFTNKKMTVIFRGLETSNFDTAISKSKVNFKKEFDNKIIIGFAGRLYKWKNVDSLIKAYYGLDQKIKNQTKLVIVGGGEDDKRLKKLDTDNLIYFTGGVNHEEAIGFQSQFDIHVHSSSPGGGLATTLLQAIYLGAIIIATPYEGADEVINNNKNGFLLKNDSIKQLEHGLKLALDNLNKREKFSIMNQKLINEKFQWKNNIDNYFNLLK